MKNKTINFFGKIVQKIFIFDIEISDEWFECAKSHKKGNILC